MPTSLADYRVIQDSKTSLRPRDGASGESKEFTFNLPSDFVDSGGSKRPFLTYFVDPSSDAKEIHLGITLNRRPGQDGTQVKIYKYTGGVGRAHIEVLSHGDLIPNQTNTLVFYRLSPDYRDSADEGSISFSDVVLWYQRNIDL